MNATFRSRINMLPMPLKMKIGELSEQYGLRPSSKREILLDALDKSKIEWTEIGTGTNRFCFRHDSYVFKTALDLEGIADNAQEWAMTKRLKNVPMTHEITRGRHLMVASYIPALTSFQDMQLYSTQIKEILSRWNSEGYLLGDVGIAAENYANWGALNKKAYCIDSAYIFPATCNLFGCRCGNTRMIPSDGTYTSYKCTACGAIYTDRELRSRISSEERIKLFEDSTGLLLTQPLEEHEVDNSYSYDDRQYAADEFQSALNLVQGKHFDGIKY